MSLSTIPPPKTSSLRWYIQRAAIVSRFVAAILVTLVSARFAIAGLEHAMGVSSANFADKPAPHATASAEPAVASAAAKGPFPAPPSTASANAVPAGRPLGVTLSINYGSPRSEVYVNGRRVGQTPFLGDTSCKAGLPLRIEIIPDKGPPLTYQRECRGRTLEISSAPP